MGIDFSKIKLVIWDLDETLWHGVLSEGHIELPPEHIELINNLVDAGVVCSICSKNDKQDVDKVLKTNNIYDLFVFSSINWSAKGERIRQIVSEMNLRAVNVLFVDDNFLNLQEAQQYCRGIITAGVGVIPDMISYFSNAEKSDKAHKRLEQYKVLEKKTEFKAKSGSNEEFLYSCHIKVNIKYDCYSHFSRIAELVARTNQLNFTKVRSTENELKLILDNAEYNCGYVCAEDDFGDYGIVGFFAVKNNVAEHFLFSCRTLNMGVEQYVYNALNRPAIDIIPDVSSSLDEETPKWINQKEKSKASSRKKVNGKILIKGPCDMEQMFSFIEPSENIITEFTYINDKGVSIEHYNHTTQIINSLILNNSDKERMMSLPFCDKAMYSENIWRNDIDVVMLSLFNDPHLGIYKENSTGILMSFGEYLVDFTNEKNWDGIINKRYFTAHYSFTKEELSAFKKSFEYIGRLNPEQVFENLKFIFSKLNKNTLFVLCLGSEADFEDFDYTNHESYMGRHLYHQELNNLVRKWASEEKRVKYIDVNNYAPSREYFLDTINHMVKSVYYQMSKEFINIVNEFTGNAVEQKKEPGATHKFIKRVKRRLKFILYGER